MRYKEVYKNYLKKLNIENPSTLNDLEEVFFLAKEDFYKFTITFDEFTGICNELWLVTHKDIDLATSHLETVLGWSGDIDWYLRGAPKSASGWVEGFLHAVNEYKKET